jgi:hypothetical protein
VGVGDEEHVVDDAGEAVADERANPVHPVVLPGPADEGGAEGHDRVHGGAVEGATDQDVGADDEADGDRGDGAEAALLGVDRGGVHCVHQSKVITIEHHRLPHGHTGQAKGAGGGCRCRSEGGGMPRWSPAAARSSTGCRGTDAMVNYNRIRLSKPPLLLYYSLIYYHTTLI